MSDWTPTLEWSRPLGLVALVLPLVLWILSLRRERPEPVPVGTFALWRELPGAGGGERRRHRVPLARWLAIAALACGALALAGPRRERLEPPLRWTVVVDDTPSMFLEHTDDEGRPTGRGTRLDVALERAEIFLASRDEPAFVNWHRPSAGGLGVGTEPPRYWRRVLEVAHPEIVWERYDDPGTLWVTDRVPDAEPRFAGVLASGGGPARGAVATVGDRWLVWDGDALVEEPGVRSRTIRIDAGVPDPIAAIARMWAAERGLLVDAAEGVELALHLRWKELEPVPAAVARDGWSASATVGHAPSFAQFQGLETWLVADVDREPRAVVTWAPGQVHVALGALGEPAGDPAAFAVSWSKLFERALLPAAGVVSLDERAAAGPSLVRRPAATRVDDHGETEALPEWPLVTLLSAAAAALGFLALVGGAARTG